MSVRALAAVLIALACLAPSPAAAQAPAASAAPSQPASDVAAGQARSWIVLGGTSTTLRGDCQEGCPGHGLGAYIHTGGVIGVAGARLNPQVDAGIEVSWVPAETAAGDDVRATFILATGQFRPLASRGFFLRGGMGMAFVRNFGFDPTGAVSPITSKALGLTYGAGWAFRRNRRIGMEVFGAQHVAALGDFETGGVTNENVVANFWSLGAAIVIR